MNIQELKPEQIVKAYSGKPGCMCGCKGKYSYHPDHQGVGGASRGYPVSDDELNLKQLKRVLRLIQKEAAEGRPVDVEEKMYACVEIGNRVYAVYLV